MTESEEDCPFTKPHSYRIISRTFSYDYVMIHSRIYGFLKPARIRPNNFNANRGRIRNRFEIPNRRNIATTTSTKSQWIQQGQLSSIIRNGRSRKNWENSEGALFKSLHDPALQVLSLAFAAGIATFALASAVLPESFTTLLPINTTCDPGNKQIEHANSKNDQDATHRLSNHLPDSFPFYEFLLKQLCVVQYSENRDSDTITSDSGRNKPTGLNGLACVHCCGNDSAKPLAEEASIFPQDRRSLAREVTTKMYQHVSECPHCPASTRSKLRRLYKAYYRPRDTKSKKIVTREERLLFRQLWYDMGHKDMAPISKKRKKRRRMLINITIEP